MVTNIFTNGTVADADEVNQNFTDIENRINLVRASNTTPFSSNTSTPVTGTVSIGAGEIINYVTIICDFIHTYSAGGAGSNGISSQPAKIQVDSDDGTTTTNIVPSMTFRTYGTGAINDTRYANSSYVYEPTANEKLVGFTITVTVTGGFNATYSNTTTSACNFIKVVGN